MTLQSSELSDPALFSPDEAVMATVWRDVLGIDRVGPDDDFFSCGGDSLLAITVVAEARKRGLPITMVHLFTYPTIRSMCAEAVENAKASDPAAADLLQPADRSKVPVGVEEVMPATRLQLGMIYEGLLSGGSAYVCTTAHDVKRPLDAAKLNEALRFVADRHEMLRTRFDLSGFSEAVQIVARSVTLPLTVADFSALDPDALQARTEEVMKELGRPFDPEQAPLIRFHAARTGSDSFRLTYSYHHAILDGWSAAGLLFETVTTYSRLLTGELPEFGAPAPYAHYVALERAAGLDADSVRHFEQFAQQSATAQAATAQSATAQAALPEKAAMSGVWTQLSASEAERLAALAVQLRLPIKSLMLAAAAAAIAAERGEPGAELAMLTSGRPETDGSDLSLGLFINYLPLRLDLGGATWAQAAARAFEAERELLPHRRFPYVNALEIVGRKPFEVSFNYVHLRRDMQLVQEGLVAPGRFADVSFEIPLGIDIQHAADGITIHIALDTARYSGGFGQRLLKRLQDAVSRLLEGPNGNVAQS